jgi:predicted DNA-binding transcriptional regulator AlpA
LKTTIRGMESLHSGRCMDLKNLISRIDLAASLGVEPQTIAKWQRLGLMPQPKECLSDRLILYDREEVRQAIERRKAARRRRVAPLRRGE